jgi:hypothetical protein
MFSGGWLPLFRALAKNMADWKNPLREINLKWDLCMYFLCDIMEDNFALRYVLKHPGVKSRVELVPSHGASLIFIVIDWS